jgi:hypothetical protein
MDTTKVLCHLILVSPPFELENMCPVSPLLEYQVNCTTAAYCAYSHTVLGKTQLDSDSKVQVDTDSENRFLVYVSTFQYRYSR